MVDQETQQQQQDLVEPLLSSDDHQHQNQHVDDEEAPVLSNTTAACQPHHGENNERSAPQGDSSNEAATAPFTTMSELGAMASLGIPLAVSFFCRMGMASTDSAFVGHINDEHYTAETYLAAAVLSDMVLNVFVTPPLAFNQVLNALVGQSMGSGNPKMAGIWLQQSCFWLTLTMLPCMIGLFYVEPILLWLDFTPDVASVAGTYAKFNLVWPIPNGLYQVRRLYRFQYAVIGSVGRIENCSHAVCSFVLVILSTLVHEILLSSARAAPSSHVQQYHFFVCKCLFELDVCFWRTSTLRNRLAWTWLYRCCHLAVNLANDAGNHVLLLHVCLQATPQSNVARKWLGLEQSHGIADLGIHEAVLAQYWNTLVPSVGFASDHCLSGTPW